MRVLILNWRDPKNPKAGGAEILTHEIAKRLVKDRHTVSQFSSYFEGAKKEEIIDGVKIIREGNPDIRFLFTSVHYKAFRYYRNELKGRVDLVIDEIHGVPFFTPLYVKEKKVALICEVAGKIWDITFRFPFNLFGRGMERIYPYLYKNINVLTISQSSKDELSDIGFNNALISVLPLGCSVPVIKSNPKKAVNPTIVFVGRLTPSKGIEDALRSTQIVKNTYPNIHLKIIGRGKDEYVNYLKSLVKELKLTHNVSFYGFIDDKEKSKELQTSHVLVSPSTKEGWGLTVHEAGARGTPAVVYDVEGLREVVINNKSGIVCKKNDYKELAKNVIKLLENRKYYRMLQKGATEESKKHTWEKTYKEFKRTLEKTNLVI